jgi:hypothetical protein
MKSLLNFILGVAVTVLTVTLYRQHSVMREQESLIKRLQTDITARESVMAAPLEYQEKCAEQARKAFKETGFKPKDMAGYENHYNAKLNKCFIMIENTDATYAPTIWTHKTLSDAYEGKSYGEYHWHTVKDKKFWEVPPFQCKVLLASGEEHICKSDDEFQELSKFYMGN